MGQGIFLLLEFFQIVEQFLNLAVSISQPLLVLCNGLLSPPHLLFNLVVDPNQFGYLLECLLVPNLSRVPSH